MKVWANAIKIPDQHKKSLNADLKIRTQEIANLK